jgi:hypothetical protein
VKILHGIYQGLIKGAIHKTPIVIQLILRNGKLAFKNEKNLY